jgi:hypothetical protein
LIASFIGKSHTLPIYTTRARLIYDIAIIINNTATLLGKDTIARESQYFKTSFRRGDPRAKCTIT